MVCPGSGFVLGANNSCRIVGSMLSRQLKLRNNESGSTEGRGDGVGNVTHGTDGNSGFGWDEELAGCGHGNGWVAEYF